MAFTTEHDEDDEDDETVDAQAIAGSDEALEGVTALLKRVGKSPDNDGDVTILLCRIGRGGVETPIEDMTFDFVQGPDLIASRLIDFAEKDILGLQVPKQRYQVRFDKLKGKSAFTLKYTGAGDDEEEELGELPTGQGMQLMMMRGYSAFAKVNIDGYKKLIDLSLQMSRDKDKRIEMLEGGQTRNLRELADLLDGRHIKEIEIRKILSAESRKDAMAKGVMQTLPMLMSRITGGGAGAAEQPGGKTPFEMQVEGLLSSFTKEQFETLMQNDSFSPEQKMTLVQIFQFWMERRQAEGGGDAEGAGSPDSP